MRSSLRLAPLLLLIGCSEDPSSPASPSPPAAVRGVYVLNEGGFSDPTGARLTLYVPEQDSVYRDVFESANSGPSLGNLGDDMVLHADAVVVYGEHVKRYLLSEGVRAGRIFVAAHAENNDDYNRSVPADEKVALLQTAEHCATAKGGALPGAA